jgi:hypothetical protein
VYGLGTAVYKAAPRRLVGWLLVPGALGLTGLATYLTDPQAVGTRDLAATLAAILAIALGILCGYPIWQSISRFLPGATPAKAVSSCSCLVPHQPEPCRHGDAGEAGKPVSGTSRPAAAR